MNKKSFVYLLVAIVLVSNVFAALTDNNTLYYSSDNADSNASTVFDLTNFYNPNNNGTLVGLPVRGLEGIINEAFYYDGTNDYVNMSPDDYKNDALGSISFWYNSSTVGEGQLKTMMGMGQSNTVDGFWIYLEKSGGTDRLFVISQFAGNVRSRLKYANNSLDDGKWWHIVVTSNSTFTRLYVNGTEVTLLEDFGTNDGDWFHEDAGYNGFNLGTIHYNNDYRYKFDGRIDEFGYWNREISQAEVTELNNNGAGLAYPYSPPPPPPTEGSINISNQTQPANDTVLNYNLVNFNLTANVTVGYAPNCSLYLNGAINITLIDIGDGINIFVNTTQYLVEGNWTYYWNCSTNDTSRITPTFDLWIDTTNPTITTNFQNNSFYYRKEILAQFNFSDNLLLHTLNVSVDNVNIFNITNIASNNYQYNLSLNATNYVAGKHLVNIRIADGHTSKHLKASKSYDWSNGFLFNDYLKFSFSKPYNSVWVKIKQDQSSLWDDWEAIEKDDRFLMVFEPNTLGTSYKFIVETSVPLQIIREPNSVYKQWLVFDDHWLDFYLGQGETVNIQRINDYKAEVTLTNMPKQSRYVFNSVGDLNIVTKNYTFFVAGITEIFTDPVLNNFTTGFYLNITGLNDYSPNVILEWNYTNYTSTLVSSATNLSQYNNSLYVNLSIINQANISHRWHFNLTNLTYEKTNYTNQTVYNIELGLCVGSQIYNLVNMTYYNEQNTSENIFVDSNDYDLRIYDGNYYYNMSGVFVGNYNDSICTNIPPSIPYTWDVWQSLTLKKDGWATRLFEINPAFPYLIGNNNTYLLDLYLLLLNESATVTFHWYTSGFQSIGGTMLVYKCVGADRTLVESTPIILGTAVTNLELLNQPYSYDIIYNGRTYSDPTAYSKCHLESDTDITYYVNVEIESITPTIGLHSINCVLNRTSNTTVSMSWGANPEAPATYVQGCIIGRRESIIGNTVVYNNCSSSGDGYFREVSVPLSGYTYTIMGELVQGNNSRYCGDEIVIFTSDNAAALFGMSALFGVFLLVASMLLFYAGEGELSLLGAGIGFVVTWIIGILNFPLLTVTMILAFLVIIVGIGRYNK